MIQESKQKYHLGYHTHTVVEVITGSLGPTSKGKRGRDPTYIHTMSPHGQIRILLVSPKSSFYGLLDKPSPTRLVLEISNEDYEGLKSDLEFLAFQIIVFFGLCVYFQDPCRFGRN